LSPKELEGGPKEGRVMEDELHLSYVDVTNGVIELQVVTYYGVFRGYFGAIWGFTGGSTVGAYLVSWLTG